MAYWAMLILHLNFFIAYLDPCNWTYCVNSKHFWEIKLAIKHGASFAW